jgi:flagellar M-ring protein FliF
MIAGLATIAVFASVLMLSRAATTPNMALLYAGLDSAAAGDVVTALDQSSVTYEIRGDSIFVDTTQRDALRMTLASSGLPANTGQGYELLDTLSGFGTTSQMFDAAYWRAKEGELARTIVASPSIRSARVHIANSGARPFQRDIRPTASVTVTTAGGNLSSRQAKALTFLIASAVSGLSPDDVSIIDDQGGLISDTEDAGDQGNAATRSAELRARVERILEARVGFGNAIVEVSVDTNTETETIVERTVDPDSRIAISTDTEERTTSSNDSGQGNVTVASNLPEGDTNGAGGSSNSQNSETRERVNFEVSETQREILRAPGAVKRVTVAVLVNGVTTTAEDGTVSTSPRSEEEMADLRELVESAVGFDDARGDQITLKSMEFDPVTQAGTDAPVANSPYASLDVMNLIQLGVLAVVALILGLFVVRPILASGRTPSPILTLEGSQGGTGQAPVLTGEIDTSGGDLGNVTVVPRNSNAEQTANANRDEATRELPPPDPVTRLRNLIEERQDETVEILRDWIETPNRKEKA